MENYVFDGEEKVKEDGLEQSEQEPEDSFMTGYDEDDEPQECAECGAAIKEERKKIVKEVEGETYVFCSKQCAQEFEDSLS
jgi:predicted sulfurtransferase